MAKMIYFIDGSCGAIFCDDHDAVKKAGELEYILRSKLGDDTANLLREVISDYKDNISGLSDEIKSYEGSCESYCSCLQDALDGISEALFLLKDKRINREKIENILNNLTTSIKNEL